MHFFPTFNSTRKRIINKWIWFLKIITSTQYRTLRMHQLKLTTNTCIHQISHLYLLSKPKSIRLSILWKKIPLPTRQETSNLFTFSSDAYLAKILPMQWSWMALWSSLPLIVYLVEYSFYQPKSQPKQRGGILAPVKKQRGTWCLYSSRRLPKGYVQEHIFYTGLISMYEAKHVRETN